MIKFLLIVLLPQYMTVMRNKQWLEIQADTNEWLMLIQMLIGLQVIGFGVQTTSEFLMT